MNVILDPIAPWDVLWKALTGIPPAIVVVAGVAALAALVAALLGMGVGRKVLLGGFAGKAQPATRSGVPFLVALSVTLMALLLVELHTWPIAASESRGGSGVLWFVRTIGYQLAYAALLLGPPALVGLGAGSYLGTPGLSRWRLGTVVLLRLLAFLLTIIAIARPALMSLEREQTTSQVFFLLDHSRSMTTQDEPNNLARWALLTRTLEAAEPALRRLRDEQQIEAKFFAFADELRDVTPPEWGEADGKRTDLGGALRQLFDRRDQQVVLRGLLVCSDGGDNGGTPALAEAMRWRGAGCAVTTFASGNPGTSSKQDDVAITSITTSPSPFVPIKGKLTVKLLIDARGYENTKARVRLYLEGDDGTDTEVLGKDVTLPLTTGNEVTLETDAPAKPGEIKVKAVVETAEPDKLPLNNTIETFVTVSKEGISVLLVDRQRAFEPQFICDALAQDARIRLTPVWVRGGTGRGESRLLDDQAFDVIILGDVTAEQLKNFDRDAIDKIERQVARGAGLLALGGYVNLGNGGWAGTKLRGLLPVDLTIRDQIDTPVRVKPTENGLRLAPYLFRIEDNADLKAAWERLAKLDGVTTLGLPNPRGPETVLAETDGGQPLLVMQRYGGKRDAKADDAAAARVLVFGGDTTYRWVRDEEGQRLHERFWRQMVVWLARQEEAEGSVWIRPDVRRLPVRQESGFTVGLRAKGGGGEVKDGKYDVEVTAPDGTKSRVLVSKSATQGRGVFVGARKPGVYKLTVKGEGTDPSGGVISGESSARVIVYDEDLETARPAADPEFLRKLATTGGGEGLRVEQLPDFLNSLAEQPLGSKPKMELRPDWRAANNTAFFLAYFAAFAVVVGVEWALRRLWGMV